MVCGDARHSIAAPGLYGLCSMDNHILYKPEYCCNATAKVGSKLQRHEEESLLQRYRQGLRQSRLC